jgi:hypothetical protein
MVTVRAIVRRPATTFGAGALIHYGREGPREAKRANRRLNPPRGRPRDIGQEVSHRDAGCTILSSTSLGTAGCLGAGWSGVPESGPLSAYAR